MNLLEVLNAGKLCTSAYICHFVKKRTLQEYVCSESDSKNVERANACSLSKSLAMWAKGGMDFYP